MLPFALLSGLASLASQAVFMRVVSAANGDYYLTYYLTTLSFIVFSALGNLVAPRLRRALPLVEVGAGLYAVALGTGIRLGLLAQLALPTWAAIALLAPPALALGVHLPLYAHFVRRHVGLTYGVYHLGAALGVIALEWFVLPFAPLSGVLLTLGAIQAGLGVLVARTLRRAPATDAATPHSPSWGAWLRAHRTAVIAVFLASVASYLAIGWGLKGYQYIVLPARMHNGLYNGAVLLALALGGLVAMGRRTSPAALSALVGVWLAAGLLCYRAAPAWLLHSGFIRLEAFALMLALLLSLPVLVSAALFNCLSAAMKEARDLSVSRLLLVSALGNVAGCAAAIVCGAQLLTVWPALAAGALLVLVLLAVTQPRRPLAQGAWLVASAVGLAMGVSVGFQPVATAYAFKELPALRMTGATLSTVLGSTAGFISARTTQIPASVLNVPLDRVYFVDGHLSHFLNTERETAVALFPAKVVDAPLARSLVIGLGSGQSALGASLISAHTDVVEISPAVLQALPTMAAYNHRVGARPDVTIHRDDALDFVRHCMPGSYDFIFNTSTYAMMFNAYKLYTDEFVSAAKRCLKPGGILQLYVDENEGASQEQVRTFLAPVARHFAHQYIAPSPYPIILASDRELRPGATIDLGRLVTRAADQKLLADDINLLRAVSCSGWTTPGPLMPTGREPLSTLDHPVIESTSMRLRLSMLTNGLGRQPNDLYTVLKPFTPATSVAACAKPAEWAPKAGAPLVVPQYVTGAQAVEAAAIR
ncbi:spermidine synthase [Burkholderia ambifaria]|uniref:spermidine synthase n=1 Tax=Burkholderia ambifaria TaxID=152480 RepID=UPI000F803D44|nr:hypothetical protein [Burkholderia ambifaria]